MNILLVLLAGVTLAARAADAPGAAEEPLDIAPVWAGHPVQFALLTHPPCQFVAFFDDARRLTVAQRRLGERAWTFTVLPDSTGWDSHNYLAMAVDDEGFLHLSGNMHAVPLNYFRTATPLDASTLVRVEKMTGEKEDRVTYPVFFRGPRNELMFTYRSGSSGNGDQIYNVYDVGTKIWKRLLDRPLTDGEGKRNAYFHGPLRGPDGWFHLAWCWRETPDAATNHDLSYARSRDLIHWETGDGRPLELPVTLATSGIVDPVAEKGGLINSNIKIGFDHLGRVTISYHKNDAAGNTQPWTARLEGGNWRLYQTAEWPCRWDFGGGGSLGFGISLGPVRLESDGRLTQTFAHFKFGSGTWVLDPLTLRAVGRAESSSDRPPGSLRVGGSFPGLQVKWVHDSGQGISPDRQYMLRWETLEANRDHPREGPLPPPSMLRLYEVRKTGPAGT